ncbi:MAG: carbohydrate ABC transporter permease [Chloroflexi bacterium]|nr:carbohydrate ABC transporter permease [Chloroflexota bacterium]
MTTNERRARLAAWVGAALLFVAAVLELSQLVIDWPFPFWLWVVATVAGLALLWTGLNRLHIGMGARAVAAVLALFVVVVIALPFGVVVVLGSLQRPIDLLSGPYAVPPQPNFDQYLRLFGIAYWSEGLRNSLIVSTTAAVLTTLLALLGAYAIASLRFPGRRAVYTSVMLIYMLPGIALLVPLVAIFRTLGLIDTLPGMVLGHMALILPLVTWLLVSAFDGVEPDLEHAARIDGAGRFDALRRVVIPLTVPSIATTAVFAFVLSWNELLVSRVLSVSSTPMLAPSIVNLMDPINRVEPLLSAAGLIASVPVLVLALVMQRYLIRGIGEGAVI